MYRGAPYSFVSLFCELLMIIFNSNSERKEIERIDTQYRAIKNESNKMNYNLNVIFYAIIFVG